MADRNLVDDRPSAEQLLSWMESLGIKEDEESPLQNHQVPLRPHDFNPYNSSASTSNSVTQRSFDPVGTSSNPFLDTFSQSFYADFHHYLNPTWVSGYVRRSDLRWEANPFTNSSTYRGSSPASNLNGPDAMTLITARDAAVLQDALLSGDPIMIENVFNVLKGSLVEIMSCKNGNLVFQKLLEVSNMMQIAEIVSRIIAVSEILPTLANHEHGSRSLQRLITRIKFEKELVGKVTSCLSPAVPLLLMSSVGHHVIHHCLTHLDYNLSEFVYIEAAKNCVALARHERGYLSFNKCIDLSRWPHRDLLLESVAYNCICLSQDPYGNYVVQHVLGLEVPNIMSYICNQLKEQFVRLCTQKYGSQVLEKLIKSCKKDEVVLELLKSDKLGQLISTFNSSEKRAAPQINPYSGSDNRHIHQGTPWTTIPPTVIHAKRPSLPISLRGCIREERTLSSLPHGSTVLIQLYKCSWHCN